MYKICSLFKSRSPQAIANRLANVNEKINESSPGQRPNDERKGTSSHSGRQQTCDGDEDKEDFFRCERDSNSSYFTSNTIWIGIIHPFLTAALATTALHMTFNKNVVCRRNYPRRKEERSIFSRLHILPAGLLYPQTTAFNVLPNRTVWTSASDPPVSSSSSTKFNEIAVQTESLTTQTTELGQASRRLIGNFENALGLDLMRNGLKTEAFEHFRNSSDLQDPQGVYNLGMCYYKGYGTKPNPMKAVRAWQKSAELGHSLAKYQLGVGHLRGFAGLTVDENLGLTYIFSAADENVTEAQNFAGAYHLKLGQMEKSKKFFQLAASAGDKTANGLLEKFFEKKSARSSQRLDTKKSSASRVKFWTGNDEDSDGFSSSGSSNEDDCSSSSLEGRNENFLVNEEISQDSDSIIFENPEENLKQSSKDLTNSDDFKRFFVRFPLKPKIEVEELFPVKKAHSVHDFRNKYFF